MSTPHTTRLNGKTGQGLRPRHGFTLIEAVMSLLIVGLMMVAALNTIGASSLSQQRNAEQNIGPMLADELMNEILRQDYQEPDDTPAFGRETGESGSNRSAWDDVDDYHGWTANPPQAKDGTALPGMTGWTRNVSVTWASSTNPKVVSVTPTGIKRIDVTVSHHGREVIKLSALRTNGWPDENLGPSGGGGGASAQSILDGVDSLLNTLFK